MKIECGCHCIKCKSTDLESNRIGEVYRMNPDKRKTRKMDLK